MDPLQLGEFLTTITVHNFIIKPCCNLSSIIIIIPVVNVVIVINSSKVLSGLLPGWALVLELMTRRTQRKRSVLISVCIIWLCRSKHDLFISSDDLTKYGVSLKR